MILTDFWSFIVFIIAFTLFYFVFRLANVPPVQRTLESSIAATETENTLDLLLNQKLDFPIVPADSSSPVMRITLAEALIFECQFGNPRKGDGLSPEIETFLKDALEPKYTSRGYKLILKCPAPRYHQYYGELDNPDVPDADALYQIIWADLHGMNAFYGDITRYLVYLDGSKSIEINFGLLSFYKK